MASASCVRLSSTWSPAGTSASSPSTSTPEDAAIRFAVLGGAARALLPLLLLAFATLTHAGGATTDVRLYVLDCGHLDIRDLRMFDDSGALDGKSGTMSVPCFLIRHPKGTLLWDTGLGDAIADRPGGVELAPGIRATVRVKLVDQ